MVRESEAPGMYLSSRSKAAAAAMLGGVRGADGGGGEGAERWAIYKGRRGESDTKKKKWNDARRRRGKFQQKQQWYDPRTLKISPHFIPHPLTSSYKQQQTPFLFRIYTKAMENPHEAEQAVLLERIIKNVVRWHHSEDASILPLTASSRTSQTKRLSN